MATRYHRLARETPDHAWWKLPVAGTILLGGFLVSSVVLLLVFLAIESTGDGATLDELADLPSPRTDPLAFAYSMLTIVLLMPCVLLALLAVGKAFAGSVCSVAGRLRWAWLGLTTALAFAVAALFIGSWFAAYALGLDDDVTITDPVFDGRTVGALLLVLAVTPFQAAAEEFVFRGYLTQLIGTWTRFWIVGAVVTTAGFTALHGYETWGLVDVGIFGFTAAVLTLRTGGLEAAIALHVANNVVLLALDAAGVQMFDSSDAGPVDVVPTILMSVVFVLVVDRLVVRRGIARTREPIVPAPVPPPWPVPAYPYPYPAQPYGWAPAPVPYPVPYPYPAAPYPVAAYAPPIPAPPRLHPDTPPYPGELGPEWTDLRP